MIFHVTIAETTRGTLFSIVTHTRHSLCSSFLRDLNLLQRVRYVNIFELSQLWYQTQIPQIENEEFRRINSVTGWFIWKDVFSGCLCRLYIVGTPVRRTGFTRRESKMHYLVP